ncbi:MAG: adenylate/guanylate cyclase domain-containing protein [Mycobacterium sp.]
MAGIPETVYARDRGVNLAFQVLDGVGPDLLFVPTPRFPIDLIWDDPTVARHLRRLSSFGRMILTDLLGLGSSDAVPINERPAMQSWTDGLLAVLDAAGSESAAVFGMAGSALPAMLLAASHPERVRSLVLWSPYACFLRTPDQPFAMPEATYEKMHAGFGLAAGTGSATELLAPSWSSDPAKRRWYGRGERLAGGPGYFNAISELFQRTDMRSVLDSIQAPTLVLHRRADRFVATGHAEYVAGRIPQAQLVEFDGDDHEWFAGDSDLVLDEVGSFLTGVRRSRPTNRVLSTVLFTDIVGSTERARALGDEAWTALLTAHNRAVGGQVDGARGRVVKFTGDGALATFDGPARAIMCACAIRDTAADLGLSVRVGLHTGEVEMVDGDVHGIAVHIAARIMALAAADEVLVSGAVPPLVLGSGLAFADRGSHELKGVTTRWPVLAVNDVLGLTSPAR